MIERFANQMRCGQTVVKYFLSEIVHCGAVICKDIALIGFWQPENVAQLILPLTALQFLKRKPFTFTFRTIILGVVAHSILPLRDRSCHLHTIYGFYGRIPLICNTSALITDTEP